MTAMNFLVTMRSGPAAGQSFNLGDEETIAGRDLSCDIPLSDPEISRRHARFFIRDGNAFVEDLGSTNGTFLNGERIASPQQLRKGDVITLGESIAMVFDKVTTEADLAGVTPTPLIELTPPTPIPVQPHHYEPEIHAQPPVQPAPYYQPEPTLPQYEEELYEPAKPEHKRKAKGKGLPTWMMVLIVAIVMLVCVIAVTMYFMPAEWWCAITFDSLAGCPLP